MFRKKKASEPAVYEDITEGLKGIYKKCLLPLEKVGMISSPSHHFIQEYSFNEILNSPVLEDADFNSKPLVMTMGQYSVGKTTFLRWNKQTNKQKVIF